MTGQNKFRAFAYTSFAINLFLLGILAGPVVTHGFGPPPFEGQGRFERSGPPSPMRMADAFSRGMTAEDARIVSEVFKKQQQAFEQNRLRERGDFGKLAEILAKPQLDRAALEAELNRMSSGMTDMHKSMSQTILDMADSLSPEGRTVLAANLAAGPGGNHLGPREAGRDPCHGPERQMGRGPAPEPGFGSPPEEAPEPDSPAEAKPPAQP